MQTVALAHKKSASTSVIVVVLGLLTALAPLSIDMYLPAGAMLVLLLLLSVGRLLVVTGPPDASLKN